MDLYALLGVSRAASPVEIERAYRRLARRYHPGINPGDRVAEELYRQVEHAFGVLGNEERRREYDRGRGRSGAAPAEAPVAFEGFDFSATADGPLAATFAELFADVFREAALEATAPSRGADLEIDLAVPFREAVRGGAIPVSILRQDRCASCGGDGRVARVAAACPACDGQGQRRWARGHMVFSRTCDACGGAGRIVTQGCRGCAGTGLHARSEVVTVGVPPGARTEDRLAIPGRGHAGARGGPAGDLYVTLKVTPHPHLRRDGRDLHLTLPLAIDEAALGARVDVPTLDAPVRLRIPPGTPSGRKFRIRGAGVPALSGVDPEQAGDLLVEVQIVLPPVRDERSKALLREFGELNRQDVRAHLFESGR